MKIACADLLYSSALVPGSQEMRNQCSSLTPSWPPLQLLPFNLHPSTSTPHLTPTAPSSSGSQAQTYQCTGQRQPLPEDSSQAPHCEPPAPPSGREGDFGVQEKTSGTSVPLGEAQVELKEWGLLGGEAGGQAPECSPVWPDPPAELGTLRPFLLWVI